MTPSQAPENEGETAALELERQDVDEEEAPGRGAEPDEEPDKKPGD